ncbi:hypothetical protein FRC00_005087 [Tulasnella sp. 408]|nr:hypothetical protein FRC00_005087 [Tulasnella sp. 408]
MSTHPPPRIVTGSGAREILTIAENVNPVPRAFSAWGSDRVRVRNPQTSSRSSTQSADSVPTAGPSNSDSVNGDTSEGPDQRSDESSFQSSDEASDQSDDDEDDQSSEGSVPQLDEEAIERLRTKINSSIVVGTRTVLNSRQRRTRAKMFDLEMSEAKGGLVFDHDETSIIFGLLCRIYDSRRIQGEEGPTLIVVPSKAHFDKWGRAARDLSEEFNLHNILIYHGRNRSPGK